MNLPPEASGHSCFSMFQETIEFYDLLSFGLMSFASGPLVGVINFDRHIIDSLKGTLESTEEVLLKGRINDAYMLLRKYYDIITINTYELIEGLEADARFELLVGKIEAWFQGTTKLPPFKEMYLKIHSFKSLEEVNRILNADTRYNEIRKRCNDHAHYNYFAYMELNSDIYYRGYAKLLAQFEKDMIALFIMHFAYLFTLRPYYMSSSDYLDALELRLKPEPGSKYWVAPFIQKCFDEIVKPNNGEIAEQMTQSTYMKLS